MNSRPHGPPSNVPPLVWWSGPEWEGFSNFPLSLRGCQAQYALLLLKFQPENAPRLCLSRETWMAPVPPPLGPVFMCLMPTLTPGQPRQRARPLFKLTPESPLPQMRPWAGPGGEGRSRCTSSEVPCRPSHRWFFPPSPAYILSNTQPLPPAPPRLWPQLHQQPSPWALRRQHSDPVRGTRAYS